jgi:Haemolysin-III related
VSSFDRWYGVCLQDLRSYHVFTNHSQPIHRLGNEFDHLGVVFVIWGSAIPSTHFGFHCDPSLRLAYWALVRTTFPSRIPSIFRKFLSSSIGAGGLISGPPDYGFRSSLGHLRSASQISTSDIPSHPLLYVHLFGAVHVSACCARPAIAWSFVLEQSHVIGWVLGTRPA